MEREKMDRNKQQQQASLKIGDYIILRWNNIRSETSYVANRGGGDDEGKRPDVDGYLSAEGILLDDVVVQDDINRFDDALFCVHAPRGYSAARELDDFLLSQQNDSKSKEENDEESSKKYLTALQRGQQNESRLNDTNMKNRIGEPVKFGDNIQLLHVKSNKYLQIIPSELAKIERENLLVTLNSAGSMYSWLQIVPKYKIDREGDVIMTAADVQIRLTERQSEFVHAAEMGPLPGRSREINCSLDPSSWKLIVFQTDVSDKSLLMYQEVVYLLDPEVRAALTINFPVVDSMDALVELDNKASRSSGGGGGSLAELGVDAMLGADLEVSSIVGEEKNDVRSILRPIDADFIDSNFLWCIESVELIEGGAILWKSVPVRLRHLNSGYYIAQKYKFVTIEGTDEEEETFYYTATLDPSDPNTLFNFNELNAPSKFMSEGRPCQIGSNGIWIFRNSVNDDLNYELSGTKDKSSSANLMVSRYTERNPYARAADSSSSDSLNQPSEPMTVFSSLSARIYMQKYVELTIIPRDNTVGTIWPKADRSDLDFFKSFITQTIFFLQGFPISSKNVVLGVDKSDAATRRRRQHLLREQNILQFLLQLINRLIPITRRTEEIAASRGRKAPVVSEDESLMLRMGHLVLGYSLNFLYYAILDNPENQIYVADFMPILLNHLGTEQPLAGKCVTEMLSKNMELQETKISEREIAIFVDKLRGAKMGAMYLDLLQSCCSCQGDGVDNNQCTVAELLFADTNDIIIQVHADYTKCTKVDWGQDSGSIYIAPTPVLGSPIIGTSLISKGIPLLSLSWTTKSIDFSPLGLFGKLSVNVEELFQSSLFNPNAKKNANSDQKLAVAVYFISELYLAAEMCMDRNYVAMHKLDPLFSYEVLLTILKLDVDARLKAAAVRLLMCLHVDRDPQASTKIPCLTRTWSEVQSSTEPKLPYVEPARRNSFALIQQLLQEHIQGMKKNRWEALSQHMLKMLKTLVNFNFYGSPERLNDVIGPLIEVLDRRQVDFETAVKSETEIVPVEKKVDTKSGAAWTGTIEGESKADSGESLEDAPVEAVVEIPKMPWQRPVLDFLESVPVLLAVLGLVAIAVALLIYQTVSGVADGSGTWLYDVGLLIMAIFIVETSTRAYCFWYLNGVIKPWLSSPFNQIDVTVISLDIMFLCLPTNTSGGGGFAKMLRLLRLLRLLRILRAARVVNALVKTKVAVAWKSPMRYSKAPLYELDAMLGCVDILSYCQQVCEDRNVSIFLRHFYAWEAGEEARSPTDLWQQILEDSGQMSLGICDFDNIMIDAIMFLHPPLVQSTLELLISHHSMKRTLLDNVNSIQLLVSHKRERQYKLVDQMLKQLECNAETHELWGELQSEADFQTNKQTMDILKELTDILRVRRSFLEFNSDYYPDVEMQNLFRNLGCFEITMKLMGLVDSVDSDEDGSYGEVSLNTRQLCYLGNQLLYWFFLQNAQNQELGYEKLPFFLDTLDKEVKSHNVIRAIFKDNDTLMKAVPHDHLNFLAELIVKRGQSHVYLSLFSSITFVGDINIPKNQFEIARILFNQGKIGRVASFLCGPDHPSYKKKVELMAPHLDAKYVDVDDLSPELAYHIALLDVLTACTVGRLNITSVEAKIQSIYLYTDVISSIMDKNTMLLVKIKLCYHLQNCVVEVEMKISGLEQTEIVWVFIFFIEKVLKNSKNDFILLEKEGFNLDNPAKSVGRQKIEYLLLLIYLINGFYERYFDERVFRYDEMSPINPGKVQLTISQVQDFNAKLLYTILGIYELNCKLLSSEQMAKIYSTLAVLHRAANLDVPLRNEITPVVVDEDVAEHTLESKVLNKLKTYLDTVNADEEIQKAADSECLNFIAVIESLPMVADDADADVRYEHFIRKLVSHVRESFRIVNEERRMESKISETATWVIKAFRTMIENKMGMSIFERDEDGGEEQDEAAWPVINALNICGATTLCLELIAVGIEEPLMNEAIMLCVALLYKEGGALEVQTLMNNFLKTNSELFFKQCRASIQKLIAWHSFHGVIDLKEGEEPRLPAELIIVRFLQLMSEGHFGANQDIMREQPGNKQQTNLLDDFVQYLNTLSRIPCRTTTRASSAVAATILEVLQGPCSGNQSFLALNTELIETINRILRSQVVRDCVPEEELDLKTTCIKILQGLLEGQSLKSIVYERVLSVIHMDVIHVMTKQPEEGAHFSEDEANLQTEATVIFQMFCDYKPSLRGEFDISSNIEDITDSDTACIEVLWHGVLNRRFFQVPSICTDLAKSTKDSFIEGVDRSTLENKLVNFLESSHSMYREVKHQQLLKEYNLSGFFNPVNQQRATWISFTLACVSNILYVLYYKYSSTDVEGVVPKMTSEAIPAVNALNILQILSSSFTVVLNTVVRTPVIYKAYMSQGYTKSESCFYTAVDPLTVYYVFYLIFALLGLVLQDDFIPFLLLDIVVKNSTTRDVLNSVIRPRAQLGISTVLILFILYLYGFFNFKYFRNTANLGYGENVCYTLWDCTKFTIGYGLRGGGGLGDWMVPTLEFRYYFDLAFFFTIQVGMLNLIAGVIITTFGQLREEKEERMFNTTDTCFTCGIDKQTFDRASKEPEGFKRHIKIDHNLWNYIYYIFKLWEQDKDDDDGLEQYVRRAVEANDISWFPMNKAMCLTDDINEEEEVRLKLSSRIEDADISFSSSINYLQSDFFVVLEQLTQAVNKDQYMSETQGGGGVQGIPSSSFAFGNKSLGSQLQELGPDGASKHLLLGLETVLDNVSSLESSKSLAFGLVDITYRGTSNHLLTCVIDCGLGKTTLVSHSILGGKALYNIAEKHILYEDAVVDDDRLCSVCFMINEKLRPTVEGQLYAEFQIPVKKMISADGSIVEHMFVPVGRKEMAVVRFGISAGVFADTFH